MEKYYTVDLTFYDGDPQDYYAHDFYTYTIGTFKDKEEAQKVLKDAQYVLDNNRGYWQEVAKDEARTTVDVYELDIDLTEHNPQTGLHHDFGEGMEAAKQNAVIVGEVDHWEEKNPKLLVMSNAIIIEVQNNSSYEAVSYQLPRKDSKFWDSGDEWTTLKPAKYTEGTCDS